MDNEHRSAVRAAREAKRKIAGLKEEIGELERERGELAKDNVEVKNALSVEEKQLASTQRELESEKTQIAGLKNDLQKAKVEVEVSKNDAAVMEKLLENRSEQAEQWKLRSAALYGLLVQELKDSRDGDAEGLEVLLAGLHEAFGAKIEGYE